MAPKPIQNIRECRDDLIDSYKNRILEIAVPRVTHIRGSQEEVAPRRKFYPVEELRKIFTIGNVRQVLSHPCPDCARHLPDNHPTHPSHYPEKVLETDATLNLFALLVLLRHPLLIGMFLTVYELHSLPLPRYFSLYDLNDRQFKHMPSRSREQVASAFQEQKWQFSVPVFTDGAFQDYQAGTILPYLDEEPIGSGSYGKVFKVWVHPSYCTLHPVQVAGPSSRNPGTKVFARKEIKGDDAIEFIKEKTNLERIATLKDPHLVQIQKTYQLGDKFNILFPWAKTNLFSYLRNSVWRAPQQVRISKNPMWEQILGITKALSKIINFPDPDEPETTIFGYHCDLKPQNILVDNSAAGSRDVFKITDFGQATFLNVAFAGSSQFQSYIHVMGGTDAYAPPEFLGDVQDRVYDIWSLAIIMLEVLAYTVRGAEALLHPETGLDNVRISKEGRKTDARFYTVVENNPILKPKIRTWIEGLLRDPSIQDNENQQFVYSLCQLILLMLEPQMKKRIGIDTVVTKLEDIFQVRDTEAVEIPAETLKVTREEKILVDLPTVDYYPRGIQGRQSVRVPWVVIEDEKYVLRTYLNRPITPLKDRREDMKVILAFQHSDDLGNDAYELSFAPLKDGGTVCLEGQSFVVDERKVARRLQIALTDHEVSERYRLGGMSLKEYKTPFKGTTSRIKTLASRPFRSSKEMGEEAPRAIVPLWVELWIEKPQIPPQKVPPTSPTTGASPAPRRANRQTQPGQNVPLGRVVVYCEDRILILPFEQECKLATQEDMKRLREQNLTFEPMDKRQCEFFHVSWLLPTGDRLPGIPMFHKNLYDAEEATRFKCESLLLKFDKPEDAYAFYRLYKIEKARWLDMKKGKPAPHESSMPPS